MPLKGHETQVEFRIAPLRIRSKRCLRRENRIRAKDREFLEHHAYGPIGFHDAIQSLRNTTAVWTIVVEELNHRHIAGEVTGNRADRKSVESGKSVAKRVGLGG